MSHAKGVSFGEGFVGWLEKGPSFSFSFFCWGGGALK